MIEWTATAYPVYLWGCPACGEVNDCGDIEPSSDEECESCGKTVNLA